MISFSYETLRLTTESVDDNISNLWNLDRCDDLNLLLLKPFPHRHVRPNLQPSKHELPASVLRRPIPNLCAASANMYLRLSKIF